MGRELRRQRPHREGGSGHLVHGAVRGIKEYADVAPVDDVVHGIVREARREPSNAYAEEGGYEASTAGTVVHAGELVVIVAYRPCEIDL